ncbi:virion structural protein [Clostridioides sp. ES-S-0123-01]|uniref:virion structural protein n=1 Tax=Clostridioides sp. ES-S-0123-01 TaxID=2770783 RepID=UPI001D1271C4|nr:virion structural protein [Clostridioides sp. ES-S-0123-01]
MPNTSLNISKIKDEIIEAVVREITSNCSTDEEREILENEFETKIKNNTLITSLDEHEISINSQSINKTMNELYIDLLTSFGVVNSMSELISKYDSMSTSYINSIATKINQIKDKLESCRYSTSFKHMSKFIIERFRNSNNFDKSRSIQKDRYGQWIPEKCYVNFDEKENILTLPFLKRDNMLRYDNKVSTASLNYKFQLGEGFIQSYNNGTSLENAIDGNPTSFWSDTILSDAPLSVSFENNKPKALYVRDNYFYGIDSGAVCDLELNFESINKINEINITPFTKYPIDIVAIRYKMTDDEDEVLIELVTPDNKDKTLKSVFTRDKVTFRFPEIICKRIYILFTQKHYIRETYVYNPTEVNKNLLWFNNENDRKEKVSKAVFKPVYYDREMVNSLWQQMNDRILSDSYDELLSRIVGNDKLNHKVLKYEYNYGLYDLGCYNNHFDRTGFYISKSLNLNSNIKSVQIVTDELHPKNSLGKTVTDIEYYITVSDNPDAKDWIPILPMNKEIIESELLFITGSTRAYFRFEAEIVYKVMKDGEEIPLDSEGFYIHKNQKTGFFWCIQIFNYDYNAVYSISYKPVRGSDSVDFASKLETTIESFNGENKSNFELKYSPFTESTVDYCDVKVVDTLNQNINCEIETLNVTDISENGSSYKNFDNLNDKLQFYIFKNSIYFNREIENKYIIDISYKHLVSKIKLKALFRRNTVKDGWLTPALKEIKYMVDTF